jgi:membrane-associated phospholipid phosphatase
MPGHTAADAAPVAASDSGQQRRWWILAHPSGSLGRLVHRHQHRRGGARRLARQLPGLARFAAVYVVYDTSRWIFAGHLHAARQHAHEIVNLERSLHLAVEGSVQRALDWGVASWLLSNVYLTAQLVVLPGALMWLYRRSPAVYRQLRNTVIATWLIAVPIFALFPVAPPRLAGVGISDSVSSHAAIALTGPSTIFYNPYAAGPSLHVGLAFAIGIAAAVALRARWARVLALSWGPLVTVSVLATGNHYLFDVAAGLLVTAVGFSAGRLTIRPFQQRPGVPSVRRLIPATRS